MATIVFLIVAIDQGAAYGPGSQLMNKPTLQPSLLRSANKAEGLVSDLQGSIAGGEFRRGERLAPIRRLASRYGISAKAVHSALKRLQGMGLVEMRQGSGTYVCYTPEKEREADLIEAAQSVALFISETEHVFGQLSSRLVAELQTSNFRSIRFSRDHARGTEQFATQFEEWRRRPPRAVVLNWVSSDGALDDAVRAATTGGSRVITTFRGTVRDWHSVDPDPEEAAAIAVRHLVSRGHTRIGLMTHACAASKKPISRKHACRMGHMTRIRGCERAMEQAGIRKGFSMLWDARNPDDGTDFHHAPTMANIAQWLSGPDRPTAVVGDDYRMVTVIKAAEKMGLRMPRDLELVGVGNTPWSEAFGFDSVWLREDLAARHIADLIRLDLERVGEATRHLVVPPQLMVRESSREDAEE
jgi:DNA-binding LacI/PurR family transcriptional regulator